MSAPNLEPQARSFFVFFLPPAFLSPCLARRLLGLLFRRGRGVQDSRDSPLKRLLIVRGTVIFLVLLFDCHVV